MKHELFSQCMQMIGDDPKIREAVNSVPQLPLNGFAWSDIINDVNRELEITPICDEKESLADWWASFLDKTKDIEPTVPDIFSGWDHFGGYNWWAPPDKNGIRMIWSFAPITDGKTRYIDNPHIPMPPQRWIDPIPPK